MNEMQNKIAKLLWEFHSLREEQVMKICNCTESDIGYLISQKVIRRDNNTNILIHRGRTMNNRNVVAFDVVIQYLNRHPKLKVGKHPICVNMETDFFTYDILAIKEVEMNDIFETIDQLSNSDRLIIIIEIKQYIKKFLKTRRPCYICTYPPLKIVDRIN